VIKKGREETAAVIQEQLRASGIFPLKRAAFEMGVEEEGPAKRQKKPKRAAKKRKAKKQPKKSKRSKRRSVDSSSGSSESSDSDSTTSDEESSEEEGEIKQKKKESKANKDKKSLFALAETPAEKGSPTLRACVQEKLLDVDSAG
jgi:hypothetical protein